MLVSVVIPTVNRRAQLVRAVQTALAQDFDAGPWEVVVVDNSPDGRQHWIESVVASQICADGRRTFRYIPEPMSGLANARNRGVLDTSSEFVVFLDDDEEPMGSGWLRDLIRVATASRIDVVFGAITPRFETKPLRYGALALTRFSRHLDLEIGAEITDHLSSLGTGNSCFRRLRCFPPGSLWFNTALNYTGGEDIDLLIRLRRTGRRFAWAPDAHVWEYVPQERLSRKYLTSLRFRQGQQRTYLQISSNPKNYLAAGFWMGIGVLQAGSHLIGSIAAQLVRNVEGAELHRIEMWGGLGKVLWHSRFRADHYGGLS